MADLGMSFDEYVDTLTTYQDIVFTNQPFLLANPSEAAEVHSKFMATSMDAPGAAELLRTEENRKVNFRRLKELCDTPPKNFEERVKVVYASIGLITLLSQMVNLPAVDKRRAYNVVAERMNKKHFHATIENLKKGTEETLRITRNETTTLRTQWPLDFTHTDACNLVKADPFFAADRLHGVGVTADEAVTWHVTAVAVRQRCCMYEVELGNEKVNLNEDQLLDLIRKTKLVYLNHDV